MHPHKSQFGLMEKMTPHKSPFSIHPTSPDTNGSSPMRHMGCLKSISWDWHYGNLFGSKILKIDNPAHHLSWQLTFIYDYNDS